jgi:acetyltransferase-like isoleucine patch superfamily enzyme
MIDNGQIPAKPPFEKYSQHMTSPTEFIKMFIEEFERIKDTFKHTPRHQALREQIYRHLISSIMTDDERAAYMGLPEGCRIRENAKIISPEKLVCGTNVWIGEGAILDASGGLEIGEHTSIGLYVLVWSHTSYLTNINYANEIQSPLIKRKATKIGNGCFISGHSVIYPGITIGNRSVVLPMSVITGDIEGNCIVAGAPAKKIRDL